jgi:hypothetical protein
MSLITENLVVNVTDDVLRAFGSLSAGWGQFVVPGAQTALDEALRIVKVSDEELIPGLSHQVGAVNLSVSWFPLKVESLAQWYRFRVAVADLPDRNLRLIVNAELSFKDPSLGRTRWQPVCQSGKITEGQEDEALLRFLSSQAP